MTKILIGVVTSEVKDYCWGEFKEQLKELQSLGHDVLIVDNSVKIVNRPPFKTIHYKDTKKVHRDCVGTGINPSTIVTRDCMNILRENFLKGDYTHLLVLESDVFILSDKIQRLVDLNADVANFTYPMKLERFNGQYSLCVQLRGADNKANMITPAECKGLLKTGKKVLNVDVVNGKVVSHCGYGCTLITRKVLEKIEFRTGVFEGKKKNGKLHNPFPDSFFHEDVKNCNFYNVLDTDYLPSHANLNDETKNYIKIVQIRNQTTRRQRRAAKNRK